MAETRYYYLSLDSDHDISAAQLEISLDRVTWAAASYVPDPPSTATALPSPAAGTTRYWWRYLFGPDADLGPLTPGPTMGRTIYGRLTDNPELLEPTWSIYT